MSRSSRQAWNNRSIPGLICPSEMPEKRAKAIVEAVKHYKDAKKLAEISSGLGEAMVGINPQEIDTIMSLRGQ